MFEEKKILCGASHYEQLFYFNPEFDSLPRAIKEELNILCVLFTEDVGEYSGWNLMKKEILI